MAYFLIHRKEKTILLNHSGVNVVSDVDLGGGWGRKE
jgi:hypothetical protein